VKTLNQCNIALRKFYVNNDYETKFLVTLIWKLWLLCLMNRMYWTRGHPVAKQSTKGYKVVRIPDTLTTNINVFLVSCFAALVAVCRFEECY